MGDLFHYLELEPFMKPRLALVTAGHLSTCPRMLKAADALAEEGYDVEVVSTRSTAWAVEADLALLAERRFFERPKSGRNARSRNHAE